MAGSATVYAERGVLSHTLAIAPLAAPATVYLGLCAATPVPTRSTGGQEVAALGYTRVAAPFALLDDPDNVAANSATVEFPAATMTWGVVGWFEVWDAVAAGNRLYWGPLVDPADGVTPITRNVQTGDIVRFSAGVVQIKAT
jgi:hypothetical protein